MSRPLVLLESHAAALPAVQAGVMPTNDKRQKFEHPRGVYHSSAGMIRTTPAVGRLEIFSEVRVELPQIVPPAGPIAYFRCVKLGSQNSRRFCRRPQVVSKGMLGSGSVLGVRNVAVHAPIHTAKVQGRRRPNRR